jgi:hypothetical protein
MKTCTKCGHEKPASEFYERKSGKGKGKLLERCKACVRASVCRYYHENKAVRIERHREWKARNPGAHRRSYYRKAYGITPEDRDAQLSAQGGKCLLCDTKFNSIPERHIHVDHDHKTGRPRGLLCHWCNTQMGTLEKSPEWIARALKYLEVGGAWSRAVHCEKGSAELKAVA